MTPKSRWEDSFPRQKFAVPVTLREIKEVGVINGERLRALIKMKDDAIHDKKAEICKLREENDKLRAEVERRTKLTLDLSGRLYK